MRATTMAYLRYHWDDAYVFAVIDGKYTARAKFGESDLLEADTPDKLLSMVRRHYPGNTGAGSCST
jgi:hypothetical protein